MNTFTFAVYKKVVDEEEAAMLSTRGSLTDVEVVSGLADGLQSRLLIVTYRFSSFIQAHTFSMEERSTAGDDVLLVRAL